MGSDISAECSEYWNISEAEAPQWLYSPLFVNFITIGEPFALCVGAGANVTFLFVLFRVPAMWTTTNVFLINVALADMLFLSLHAASNLWSYAVSPSVSSYPFENSASCSILFIVLETGYFASVALVTMVTYEKYLALCYPMEHLKIRGSRRVTKIVLTCWLVGLMFACIIVPEVALTYKWCVEWPNKDEYQDLPSTVVDCVPVKPNVIFYNTLLRSGPWSFVMICNIYMCVKLVQTLVKQTPTVSGGVSGRGQRAQQRKRQVAVMIIVNSLVFFLCQAPFHALKIIEWIYLIADMPSPIYSAMQDNGYWLGNFPHLINTIINPFIYGALSAQYRAAFLEAFRCRRRPRKQLSMLPPPVCAGQNLSQGEDQI